MKSSSCFVRPTPDQAFDGAHRAKNAEDDGRNEGLERPGREGYRRVIDTRDDHSTQQDACRQPGRSQQQSGLLDTPAARRRDEDSACDNHAQEQPEWPADQRGKPEDDAEAGDAEESAHATTSGGRFEVAPTLR